MFFTISQILAIASTCIAVIVAAVPIFNAISARVDARRKAKKEEREAQTKAEKDVLDAQNAAKAKELETHLSLTTELAKIDAEREDGERDELRELMQFYRARCGELEAQFVEQDQLMLLSRTKKRQIRLIFQNLNKAVYALRKGFEGKYHFIELEANFRYVEKYVLELEDALP